MLSSWIPIKSFLCPNTSFAFSRNFSLLEHSLLSFAPRLCAVLSDTPPFYLNDCSLPLPLLQGPQSNTVVMHSFKLPNPSHLCEKLVLTSTIQTAHTLHLKVPFMQQYLTENRQQLELRHFQPQLCTAFNTS